MSYIRDEYLKEYIEFKIGLIKKHNAPVKTKDLEDILEIMNRLSKTTHEESIYLELKERYEANNANRRLS